MAGQQFQVHPPTVASLATKFHTEAHDLTTQISTFESGASNPAAAFGVLGACDGAAKNYASLLTNVSKALGQLSQVLDGTGERLTATAGCYTDVDRAVETQAKSVGRAV
ncbi:WXG100 family type VII secretion target [Kitasatospora sp. GAS204B]|uniref:WXG100 family type VII secretion target n=1 Tax=unclassified Kitasatospora TaxID=2633591 RepID=UPI0024743EB0|nr:type VII secretion target [Kitasatospora sp. GAS204B]MDH6117250.1 uncharacterized protein YukE [Kitasatospora sp. GAS204B]